MGCNGSTPGIWSNTSARFLGLLLAGVTLVPGLTGCAGKHTERILGAADSGAATNFAGLVNPFAGTAGSDSTGSPINTFPGADMPFGMVQWSPDTWPDRSHGGGYDYNDSKISGFSLTHLSGPGCSLYGDFPILPTVGVIGEHPGSTTEPFSHARERASPGYYQVRAGRTRVRLTVTPRTGYGLFTFPAAKQANILVNVGGSATKDSAANADIVGDEEIAGSATAGHFCHSRGMYTIFFAARFDRPFASHGTWNSREVFAGSGRVNSPHSGAYVTFDTTRNAMVQMKVGVSFVSVANARVNLKSEDNGWDFSRVRGKARATWDRALSTISVLGGTLVQRKTFYTSLYHSLLYPNLFSDVQGQYSGFDDRVHTVPAGQGAQYANFSGWDIYRSEIPLLALIEPTRTGDMMQSLVNDAVQSGWFDRWPAANAFTGIMSGDPADAMISEAYALGVRNFDVRTALRYMVKGATETPTRSQRGQGWYIERPQLAAYLNKGYVPSRPVSMASPADAAASKTLEYATDDFTIARLAKAQGKSRTCRRFMVRSQNWRNEFNRATGYIQPREQAGEFPSGNPTTAGIEEKNQAGFAEGDAAQYTWMVPQDLHGLFAAMGGNDMVVHRLDRFFGKVIAGRTEPFENIGNEPGFGTPWEYDFAGAPYKTQEVVRKITNRLFSATPGGEPGNDDLGSLSSWYVWASLGLYPETPGAPALVLGSPQFPQVNIALSRGRKLVIAGSGASADAPYVQALRVNRVQMRRTWVSVTGLLAGRQHARLEFRLGRAPNVAWGREPKDAPPSYGGR